MMLDDVDPKTNQRTSTETIGTSEHFVYDDAKRLATYTPAPRRISSGRGRPDRRADRPVPERGSERARTRWRRDGNGHDDRERSDRRTGRHLTYTPPTRPT